jgi:hypothetical protein
LDDGEVPEELIANVENPNHRSSSELSLEDGKVVQKNNSKPDYKQAQKAHLIILICF